MKVTALAPDPRHPERWHLTLDDGRTLTLPGEDVFAHDLHAGGEVAPDLLEALERRAADAALYEAALRYLAARPRSRVEVRRRLLQRRPGRTLPDAEAVDRVLARLEQMGYLDDAAFAAFWADQRERFSPRAAQTVAAELRQRGVDRETAAQASDAEGDAARALVAGRARLRTVAGADWPTFRARLGGYLLRRGFSYGIVRVALRQLWDETHDTPPEDADDAE